MREFSVLIGGRYGIWRHWDDMRRFGFVSAGHKQLHRDAMTRLGVGDRVWVRISSRVAKPFGYVGVGEVTATATAVREFTVELDHTPIPLLDVPLRASNMSEHADDPELTEYVVRVRWSATRPQEDAYWEPGLAGPRSVVAELADQFTLRRLQDVFLGGTSETHRRSRNDVSELPHPSTPQRPQYVCNDGTAGAEERPIEELDLSRRSYNCLRRAGVATVADLTSRHESELMAIPNFGRTSLREIVEVLGSEGLELSSVIRHPLPRPGQGPPAQASERSDAQTHGHREAARAAAESAERRIFRREKSQSKAVERPGGTSTLLAHFAESDVRAFAIEQLSDAAHLLGHPPDAQWWEETGRIPGVQDIVVLFGTWEKALAAVPERIEAPDTAPDTGAANAAAGAQDGRETMPYRARRVLELREEGHTLEEVGQIFGVSRERIRQIEKQYGGIDAPVVRERTEARLRARAEASQDEILQLFRAGHDMRDISRHLSLPTRVIDAALSSFASRADRAEHRISRQRRRPPAVNVFSDDDLLAAIRAVSDSLGRTPSSGDYLAIARASGFPSLPTVANRFGSWSAAVLAAGLVPRGPGRGNYDRRWTELRVRTALELLLIELGSLPTAEQYEMTSESDPRLPSLATVRNRLGRWSMVTAELEAEPPPSELLSSLGVETTSPDADRQERMWLAYIAGDLSDRDLRVLILSGNFHWDASYGQAPVLIVPALETNDSYQVETPGDEQMGDD